MDFPLLFLSENLDQCKKVIEKILQKFNDNNDELFKELQQLDCSQQFFCFKNKMHIESKYYSAQVQIYLSRFDNILDLQKAQGIFYCMQVKQNKEIIGREGLLNLANDLYEQLEPSFQAIIYDTNLKICDFEQLQDDDSITEFIEPVCDNLEIFTYAQKNSSNLLNDDLNGMYRVYDILECHTWSGLILKDKPQKLIINKEDIQIQQEQQLTQNVINEIDKDFEKQEQEMEEFSQLMQEMRTCREKQQIYETYFNQYCSANNVSDEQRKKNAQQVLEKFMKMCGQEFDDDDDYYNDD